MRLILLILCFQTTAFSQYSTKRVIVDGQGSPLVLLAGGRWDMHSFSEVAVAFSSNHKVVRMEHFNVQYANEGLQFPNDYSVQKESEAIGRTLDSLQISEQINLVGWSYGALIAMDFALNHPDRVKKLVLYEPPAFWIAKARGESPAGMQQMIDLTQSFTIGASITEAQLAQFKCILDGCDTAAIRSHPQWSTWVKQKNRLRGLSAVANHGDSISKLHAFNKPVLILTGQRTVAFHRRINELLKEEFSNSILEEIAGGHSAPKEDVVNFIQAVKQFID